MNKQILPLSILLLAVAASMTQAWTPPDLGTSFKTEVQDVLNTLAYFICTPVCFIFYVVSGIATLAFILAGLRYIAADDPGTRSQLRGFMTSIIVGLVLVILAIPIVNYVISGLLPEIQCTCISEPVENIGTVFCNLICFLASIGPALCALVMLYGGLRYVTSADDPEARASARNIITNALIGLIIIMIAIPLVNIVISDVLTEVTCYCFEDIDPAEQIGRILCNFICFIATIAPAICALVMLYGGLKWITSGDDTGARNAAKNTIIAALIGIIFVMLAVPIVNIVIGVILPQQVRCDCLPDLDPAEQISRIMCNLICLFTSIAPAVSVLAMIYGGLRYVVSEEDPDARNAAKNTITSALVGLIFVMIAVPLVNIVLSATLLKNVECGCFNIGDPVEQLGKILCSLACALQYIAPPIAVIVIAYGGLRYMTSGNDPGARAAARSIIINGIVGLMIIGLAIPLINVVLSGMLPGVQCDCVSLIGSIGNANAVKDDANSMAACQNPSDCAALGPTYACVNGYCRNYCGPAEKCCQATEQNSHTGCIGTDTGNQIKLNSCSLDDFLTSYTCVADKCQPSEKDCTLGCIDQYTCRQAAADPADPPLHVLGTGSDEICAKCCGVGKDECHYSYQSGGQTLYGHYSGITINSCSPPTNTAIGTYYVKGTVKTVNGAGPELSASPPSNAKCVYCSGGVLPGECSGNRMCVWTGKGSEPQLELKLDTEGCRATIDI
jgi:hypothetical protein